MDEKLIDRIKLLEILQKIKVDTGRTKQGDQKKLSERDRRRVINAASNSMKSLSQIANECGINVSKPTISRVLKESGTITRQKLMTMPKLLPRHKQARLDFAKNNLQTNWNKVSFMIIVFFSFF